MLKFNLKFNGIFAAHKFGSGPSLATSADCSCRAAAMASSRVRIAVVGDVHGDWDPVLDARALEDIKPNLVLFTGDFGNEDVTLVAHVSNLDFPKAVILGNHDGWFTDHYDPSQRGAVDLQLQSLGECHVGYKRLEFPDLKISVIGGRPFSWGGPTFGPAYDIVCKRFSIKGMNQSSKRISELALTAPLDHALVFLGHNGPTGLGSKPNDICGKDWSRRSFADHGDPDLEAALKAVKEKGTHNVQLVVFGHMHKTLALNRGFRTMLVTSEDRTMYVNAAVVPRVQDVADPSNEGDIISKRNFTVIDLANGEVERVAEVWIEMKENIVFGRKEQTLFTSIEGHVTTSMV